MCNSDHVLCFAPGRLPNALEFWRSFKPSKDVQLVGFLHAAGHDMDLKRLLE